MNNLEYPTKIAASLVRNCKAVSQDDVDKFVITTKKINEELIHSQNAVRELKRKLVIIRSEKRFLEEAFNLKVMR